MEFDLSAISPRDGYKLLASIVVPRPIALVTTVSPAGAANAAAFSFFNAVAFDPCVIALGIEARLELPRELGAVPKDTSANIRATGEFVVNLVDEPLVEAMNLVSIEFPPEVDELALAGLATLPSTKVRAPRIAQSPAAMECKRLMTIEIARGRNIVLGEVVQIHIRDDLVDTERLRVAGDRMGLVARMHGDWYARTTDLFESPRPTLADWKKRSAG